jgi:gliding motility-associated protein GldM
MGHGKETPRQKMIGMMYLVLTAMLALNVSKEVLDAFVLVDNGLAVTTENFAEKNEAIYSQFAMSAEQNPEKYGIWVERANELHAKTDELYDFIQECKLDIISNKDEAAIHDGHYDWHHVKVKDNLETGAEVMITEEGGRRYKELKSMIDDLREYLLSIIDDKEKYAATVEAIETNLSTEPPDKIQHKKQKAGTTMSWQSGYFEDLPLAAIITLLSKMQADARNVEAEMLNYLLGQVDAGAVPVNTIEAVVIAERSLVFKGVPYNAKVFLAAYDSTNAPSVTLDDGTTLEIEGGKGIYTATSNSIGIRKWGGTIELQGDGISITRPFEAEYEVAEANATISATGMNVFYRGIPNPVEISAGGVAESTVRATISSGRIDRIRPGEYVVKPGPQGNRATVSVYSEENGTRTLMNRMDFRVFNLPTPDARVQGVRGSDGNLSAGQLAGLQEVRAEAEDFVFEVDYKVQSFDIAFQGSGGIWSTMSSNSERFTPEQKNLFRQLRSGQRIMIEKIKATGPDGVLRTLNNITIKVI